MNKCLNWFYSAYKTLVEHLWICLTLKLQVSSSSYCMYILRELKPFSNLLLGIFHIKWCRKISIQNQLQKESLQSFFCYLFLFTWEIWAGKLVDQLIAFRSARKCCTIETFYFQILSSTFRSIGLKIKLKQTFHD